MNVPRGLTSVRGRTTVVAAGVVGIALVIGAIGLLGLLRSRLEGAERTTAALRARDVAALVQDGRLPSRLSFPGEERALTQVVDGTGVVSASTANVDGEPAVSSLRPAADTTDSEVRSNLPIGDGERYVLVARGVDTPTGLATVYSAASLEAADQTFTTVLIALAAGLPVLVILVALTTRRLVGSALRPVEGIRSEVAAITQRDLHRRVPEPQTGDEIDRLASTMNEMLTRLEASAERQGRFVADASHELRSPLASARTTLEVATAHPGNEAQLLSAIEDALVDHDRLDRLVRDLLTLARFDNPGRELERGPIDVAELTTDEVERLEDERVDFDQPRSRALVHGDRSQLSRVVVNLIDNALDHGRNRVDVAVETTDGAVLITVDDDGPGVAADDRARIFEPFIRLDNARVSDGGTGLGLAIVRDIVLAHGGTVQVGDAPIGGARFTVTLASASPEP